MMLETHVFNISMSMDVLKAIVEKNINPLLEKPEYHKMLPWQVKEKEKVHLKDYNVEEAGLKLNHFFNN